MGGVSTSSLAAYSDGRVVFEGRVSLENSGGFASAWTESAEFGLDGFTGFLLEVRGDGKRYKARVRTGELPGGMTYERAFVSPGDDWQRISLRFSDFIAVRRGKRLVSAPPLPAGRIQQIGFLISDRQPGEFRLEIRSIAAFQDIQTDS